MASDTGLACRYCVPQDMNACKCASGLEGLSPTDLLVSRRPQGNNAKYSHCLSHCFDEWQAFSHHRRIYGRDRRGSGHRARCRARLLILSLRLLNSAGRSSTSSSSYHEAGWLSQDQQAMRLVPLPPGGALRGYHMFI